MSRKIRKVEIDRDMDSDYWYKRMNQFAQLFFLWLIRKADHAGVVEFNTDQAVEELKSSPNEVEDALRVLLAPYQGVSRVLRGLNPKNNGQVLVLRNYVKIQQNGYILYSSNRFHKHIIDRLDEVKTLVRGLDGVYEVLQGSSKTPRDPGKGIGREEDIVSSGEGESGGGKGADFNKMVVHRGKCDGYDLLLQKADEFPLPTWEKWVILKKAYPKASPCRAVKMALATAEGREIETPGAWLKARLSEDEVRVLKGELSEPVKIETQEEFEARVG